MKKIRRSHGFTLIELAVVLVVVAFLTGSAVMVLRMQMQRTRLANTQSALDDAREAILGYAQINGGLPCPASDIDGGPPTEPASCTIKNGFVPWQRLGLPQTGQQPGVDAWGKNLHYMVSANLVVTKIPRLSTAGNIEINDGTVKVRSEQAIAFAIWSEGDDKTDSASVATDDQKLMIPSETYKSDDLVTWVSRYALIGRMLSAGRVLPD